MEQPLYLAQTTDLKPNEIPHNLEAEQALLGALLFDNECFNKIGDELTSHHFYDPIHAKLYEAIQSIIQKGMLADAVTLKNRFQKDQALQEIGGIEYLAHLLSNAASFSAISEYARLIVDLSVKRELIRIGNEIQFLAQNEDEEQDSKSQLEIAEKKLFDLAESGSSQSGFIPFKSALIQSIDTAAAAYKRDGNLSGIATGLIDLDRKLGGLHASDLIILAGRPSMGKTALATNIAFHIARHYQAEKQKNGDIKTVNGGIVGFFSLEMSSEQLATRLIAETSRIPSHRIRRGDISSEEYEILRDVSEELESIPLYIDDTGGLSIHALMARARRLKRTIGLDLIVVDYLQLVTSSERKGDNRVQEVSEITQNLKALAKELNIPVLALSQLSRQVENREDKKPQLADLRESGSIEQDADVVMFVYREAYYLSRSEPNIRPNHQDDNQKHKEWQEIMEKIHMLAEIIIGKQRHGPIGTVKLSFEEELTKFGNLDETR